MHSHVAPAASSVLTCANVRAGMGCTAALSEMLAFSGCTTALDCLHKYPSRFGAAFGATLASLASDFAIPTPLPREALSRSAMLTFTISTHPRCTPLRWIVNFLTSAQGPTMSVFGELFGASADQSMACSLWKGEMDNGLTARL